MSFADSHESLIFSNLCQFECLKFLALLLLSDIMDLVLKPLLLLDEVLNSVLMDILSTIVCAALLFVSYFYQAGVIVSHVREVVFISESFQVE